MNFITRICLLACVGLAPLVHSSAAEETAWPFFAFDNGVGRGVWSAARQAETVRNLGYEGIHFNYTHPKDFAAKLSACRAADVPIHAVYIYTFVDQPGKSYDPGIKEMIRMLKGSQTIIWMTLRDGVRGKQDAEAAGVVREIAALAAESGLKVSLYPHAGFYVATAEDAVRIAKAVDLPNVGVSINLCHELFAGNGERLAVFSSANLGAGDFDSSVGLSSSKTYFNAVNIEGGALTINGVNFEGSAGGNPSGTGYAISGVGATFGPTGGTNHVGGQLGSLLNNFIYNGNLGALTLSGLTPGQTYSLAFYNRSWSGPGGRAQNITSTSGATTSFEQDPEAPGNGNLLRYTFTASGTTEAVNFTPPAGQGTMHFYGFSTEQVFNNTRTSGTDWTTANWSVGVPNAAGANADFTA